MKSVVLSVIAAVLSSMSFAANYNIDDLSVLNSSFYKVGDTITLPTGTYTILGDAIATLSDNVITCKKAGFTRVTDSSSVNYRVCVYVDPPSGGDTFYFANTSGDGQKWTQVAWTNLTQNTGRTVPNDAKDIAVVEGKVQWAKMYIDAAISVHGYVVGASKQSSGSSWVQLGTANGSTLTFCGSEEDPAFINLTSLHRGDGTAIRIGAEKGSGNAILNINVDAKVMNFDWCGDSADVGDNYRNKGTAQFCSAIVNVPAGNELRFINSSKKVTDTVERGSTSYGRFSGAGSVVFANNGGTSSPTLFNFADDEFSGVVSLYKGDWENQLAVMSNATLIVYGAPCAGRQNVYVGYSLCTSNPGCSQIDAKSVTMDGGFLQVYRNYADKANLDSWTNDVTSADEIFDRLTVTNEIKKLILNGDNAMCCEAAYNGGNGRVRQYVYLDDIDRIDTASTLLLYDFNFRDNNYVQGPYSDRVRGDGLEEWAVGKDPEEGDSAYVYKTIPWIAVTVNDNAFAVYNVYGSQMSFPKLVDGVLYSNRRASLALNSVVSEWENVFFNGKGIGISSDKVINSFSYSTGETPPYPSNLVLGNGRKLTIKSGGMIFCCNNKWFGATQTDYFSNCGTVEFGGEHAYLISDYGVATGSSDDWNVMWAPMIATNGLVKAGCGELVIAADQRGVDSAIWVNGGTLWLGHPANYRQKGWLYSQQASNSATVPVRGCVTDAEEIFIRPGGVLAVPIKGYDVDGDSSISDDETAIYKRSTIRLVDNIAGTAKLELAAGADQTCAKLYINSEKALTKGTYGATGSGAETIDDLHFLGTGKLTVRKDDIAGMMIYVR